MLPLFNHQLNFSVKSLDDSFVYRLVNRVLRTNDPDLIYPYRFFINDLYNELMSIDREHCEYFDDLVVYRGQCITEVELNYLKHYVGQLLTLASFTSTTIDRDTALIFGARRDNLIGILFEIHLNITLDNTRPFAYVGSYSAMPDELEVLISMGAIFKLISITYNSENDMWLVVLDLCRQHSRDIKNFTSSKHTHSKDFDSCKPIPFRRSSTPTNTKYDANLKRFIRTTDFNKKTIEKTQSLPILTANDIEQPIRRADSLQSKHGLTSSLIRVNMEFFQEKQQRKRNKSKSYPNLFKISNLQQQRCSSLPLMYNNNVRLSIIPRFLLEKTNTFVNDIWSNDSSKNDLFTAGIYDAIMVFNFCIEENTDNTISLKQQVDELRHELRDTFNLERGRWCSEY